MALSYLTTVQTEARGGELLVQGGGGKAALQFKAQTNSESPGWGGCCVVREQAPERFLSRMLAGQSLGNT